MARSRKKLGDDITITRAQNFALEMVKKINSETAVPTAPPALLPTTRVIPSPAARKKGSAKVSEPAKKGNKSETTKPAAPPAPPSPIRTSPRQAARKKTIAIESESSPVTVVNKEKGPKKKEAVVAQAHVLVVGKKRKKEDSTTAAKKGRKKGKVEDVPPDPPTLPEALHLKAPTDQHTLSSDKENPSVFPVGSTHIAPVTLRDTSEDIEPSVVVSRQPFGQSLALNLSDFKSNKEIFSALLRTTGNSDLDRSLTKLPALVTQVPSSQESISTETARNLTVDMEVVADHMEIVVMEVEDKSFDFLQSLKEWELNNVMCLGNQWLRLDQPENKAYEANAPCPPLENISSVTGIDQFMTSFQQSKFVRRFFPNINRRLVATIQTVLPHNYASKDPVGLSTFPLEDFIALNPWNNLLNSDSPLQQLCKFDVFNKNPGKGKTLKLRKRWELSSQRRAWMGFVHRVNSQDATNSKGGCYRAQKNW